MNDVLIIDDIIPKDYQNKLLYFLTETNFAWIFHKNLIAKDEQFKDNENNPLGFTHNLYDNEKPVSPDFNFFYPLVLSITSKLDDYKKLIRIRANLTLPNKISKLKWHMPHTDSYFDHLVAIYYVNDSDGDTFVFNETNDNYSNGQDDIARINKGDFTVKKQITPKQGRVAIFSGKNYHTSSWAKESKFRCLLNINLGK